MQKINFKKPLITLGTPVVDHLNNQQFLNSELPFYLNSMNVGNTLKVTSICLRILEQGEVELDKPDFDFLKNLIDQNRTAPGYMITAALECIEQAQEIKKEPITSE